MESASLTPFFRAHTESGLQITKVNLMGHYRWQTSNAGDVAAAARALCSLPRLRHLTLSKHFHANSQLDTLGLHPLFTLASFCATPSSFPIAIDVLAWYLASSHASLVTLNLECYIDPEAAHWCVTTFRALKRVRVSIRGSSEADDDIALELVRLPELRQLDLDYLDERIGRSFHL